MIKVMESISLYKLAEKLGGEAAGEDVDITDVSGIDDVAPGEITWVEGKRNLNTALKSPAAALIISCKTYNALKDQIKIPRIIVKNPKIAFALTLGFFYRRSSPAPGIASTARIGKSTVIGRDVSMVGKNCVIGDGSIIYPLACMGDSVKIGRNTIIYPFGVIHNRCILGNDVIIHSGAVIGADGFGFVDENKVRIKILQVGIVSLGDKVEVGANVTIDRATTGITSIGEGTKIDNLIQVGHNNHIGKNCILVSQSGIAGSCEIGDNVTLAAQSGLAPHIKIGSNTVVGGRGGVTHDIPANSIVSGFPARPHREALKLNGHIQRLPIMAKTVKELEQRLARLEKACHLEIEQ